MIANRQTKKDMLSTVDIEIASSKLIANNTVEYYDHEGVKYIRLHNTDIIIDNGKTTRLYTGGWRTVTTKDRLNTYTPPNIGIYSEKGEWVMYQRHLTEDCKKCPFYEGIEIDNATGNVKPYMTDELQDEIDAWTERVRLNKLIKKYCKIIENLDTLPQPGPGDCWFCLMFERVGLGSSDHLVSHLEEECVHGALLWNALKWAGANPNFYLTVGLGSRDSVVRSVRRYFKAKLGFAS